MDYIVSNGRETINLESPLPLEMHTVNFSKSHGIEKAQSSRKNGRGLEVERGSHLGRQLLSQQCFLQPCVIGVCTFSGGALHRTSLRTAAFEMGSYTPITIYGCRR